MQVPRPGRLPLFLALIAVGCGDAGGAEPDAGGETAVDAAVDADPGCLPDPLPATAGGLAIVGYYHSEELSLVRTDGEVPVAAEPIAAPTLSRDLALDPYNLLLAVVADLEVDGGYPLTLYRVTAPASPEAPTTPPALLATIPFTGDEKAIAARFDPLRDRLFVTVAALPPAPRGMLLRVYDLADPTAPTPIADSPIASSAFFDVDPLRRLLFTSASEGGTTMLHAYSIATDEAVELPGSPLDLEVLFPEDPDDQLGFSSFNITVDPNRARVLMPRTEGKRSELMALAYPPGLADDCATYPHGADAMAIVPDGFDVVGEPPYDDVDEPAWAFLRSAYQPDVDPATGALVLMAFAGDTTVSGSILVPMDADLQLQPPCEGAGFHGFGCFVRFFDGGEEVVFGQRTDGAMCVDWKNRVVVAPSVSEEETAPGRNHLYRLDDAGVLSPWLPTSGTSLLGGPLAVGAVCL